MSSDWGRGPKSSDWYVLEELRFNPDPGRSHVQEHYLLWLWACAPEPRRHSSWSLCSLAEKKLAAWRPYTATRVAPTLCKQTNPAATKTQHKNEQTVLDEKRENAVNWWIHSHLALPSYCVGTGEAKAKQTQSTPRAVGAVHPVLSSDA